MNLLHLINSLEIESIRYPEQKVDMNELNIEKIAYHSKEVIPETLFVCIKGQQADGHQFAKKAVEQGAVAVIVEEYVELLDVLQIRVNNTREALASVSSHFFGQPSKDMRIFGVTATNGKTTITYMTDEIFSAYGLKKGLIGTIQVKINDEAEMSFLTTPESYELQKYFAKMRDKEVTHVSMEVSSSALELKRVHETAFDIVAFMNISPEHIQLHESFEAYFNAKASLIREASPSSSALINLDEPLLIPLAEQTEAQVVTFGVENDTGTVTVSDIDLSTGKSAFTMNIVQSIRTLDGKFIEPDSYRIELAVPGFHSIYNAVTAVLTGLINDIPFEVVKQGIENFKGVERRFQILYDNEFKVIDDLLLNKNNIDSCMEALGHLKYNDLHLVHAIRGSNGPALSREISETLVDWFRKVNMNKIILTTSQSNVMKKDAVTEEELNAFLEVMEKAGIEVDFFEELEDALRVGVDRIQEDDLLLISGAHSMDTGANRTLELIMEKYPYVDKEAIYTILNSKLIGMPPVQSN